MRISHAFTILVITSCTAHGLAQEGVIVRVGRDIDIDEGRILFPVPPNVFQLKWHPRGLVWRTDFEDLTIWKAPGFDAGLLPDSADHHWIEEIDAYYSVVTRKGDLAKDFGSDPQTVNDEPQLERISRLPGLPLLDASTNALGTVRRLIFDRDAERIRYIVIQDHEPDGNSSRPDAILVPIESVTCTTIADTVQLTTQLTAVQFMNAPRVRLTRALQPEHEDWTAGVDAWFNVTSSKSTDQAVDR